MKKILLAINLFLFVTLNSFSSDRFWVGGTGLWSDASHWSAVNGGVGGASIPDKTENVFFTSTSFNTSGQTVTLDANAACASISWKGVLNNPMFQSPAGTTLNIYGSLKLDPAMQFDVKSDIYFKTSNSLGSTIFTAGHIIPGNIYIDAANGNVLLNDDLTTATNSSIYIVNGVFNSNSKNITCGSVISLGDNDRKLNLGSSIIRLHGRWDLKEADNLDFDGSNSTIVFVEKLKLVNFQTHPSFNYGVIKSNQQSPLSHSVTVVQRDSNRCANDCKGSAVATITGGIGPYIYYWGGYPARNSAFPTDTLKNLCGGSYSLFVEDVGNANEVIPLVPDASIQSVAPVNVVFFNNTPSSCNGSCNGKATAVANGGTLPFTYSWSNSITTPLNNNICAGTYSVTVTDKNNCTGTNSVVITQPAAINLNSGKTDVSCFGVCIGSAGVSPTGGTTPYSYLWNTGATSPTITGRCAGTYTLTLTDNKGCTVTFVPAINQPAASLSGSTAKTDVTCFSACNGTALITATGGTTPYTYLWSNGATAATLSALCASNYTVTITDANGCTSTSSTSITEPTALTTAPTGTNVTCFNACNGTANANPSGGTIAYTYSWSPGGATTATVGSLCPATYSLIVTDSKGCTATSTVVVTEPAVLAANVTKTDISCNSLCNGTATSAPTGGTSPYTYAWSDGSTTALRFGLCVNSYTVTVIDANSCTSTASIAITQPITLTITRTFTNASCNDICDGTITTTTTDGTTPYTYIWSSGPTSPNLSGLCDAGYTVTVTDANSCTATTVATITEPNLITASISTTPISCNLSCNATAAVSAGGGTAPFSQVWSTGDVTPTITGLCAATYTVTVTDAKGCTATSTTTITQPTPLGVSLTPTHVTCSGLCNGSITSTPSGGTTTYTYSWSSGTTTQNILGLCIGGYTLTLTDANGCTTTSNVTITAPLALSATTNVNNNVSCNGGCDGSVTVNPGGGTPAYTYAWSNTSNTQTISGLCLGTYTVTVTDANGCQSTQTVAITQPTALNASLTSNTASCGLCNGTATASPAGGSPGYGYLWPDLQATPTAIGLCVGTYTVTVNDTKGCTATGTVNVLAAVNILVTASSSSLSCFNACVGVATANASGGVSPYTYLWTNGSTSSNATNLCSGTYTVTATDSGGCSSTATTTFVDPPVIIPNASRTNTSCTGVCDGTALATPTGGTGAYTYSWSTSATTATISALCAGDYTVTITDANVCTQTSSVTVTEPAALNDNEVATSATCGLCDGTISVTPSGGSAAYTYAWAGPAAFSSTGQNISALCIGSYTLTLTAGGTCQSVFNYTISNVAGPTITKTRTNAFCNGECNGTATATAVAGTPPYLYSWSTGSTAATVNGLCFATYNLSVTDGLGCVTVDTLLIKQPTKLAPNPVSADVTCGGAADGAIILVPTGGTPAYTYSWSNAAITSTITNLSPGPYTFTVTDANGCDSVNTITITEPAVLTVSTISTDVTCKGVCDGSAFAFGAGGTSPYTYSWTSGAILDITVNLCPGTYTVTITDANTCSATSTVTITEPTLALTATIGKTDVSCNGGSDGTTFVNPSGGTVSYSYNWVPGGGQTAATATNLFAGPYNVTITDANGCTFVGGITVNEPAVISFTVNQVNVSCNSTCNGSIDVAAAGGNAPFSYLWSTSATGQTVIGLCLGGYTVTATDSKGCTNSRIINITEPAILLANITGTDPNCLSSTSGSAVSNPAGGTAAYTYLWSNGASTQTNSSLSAATYTVTVTDSQGCTDTQSVTLLPAVPITVIQAVNDANCGVCNGTIAVTPSGGTPAYTYSWNTAAVTSSLNSLCAGNYSLTVTDANTCSATFVIPVNNTGGPTGETVVSTDNTCNASCNGTATITPIGGTPPYAYLWTDNLNVSNSRTSMCAATYTLQVTDAIGCIRNSSVTITEPSPIIINASVINVSCSGICDATITLSASGGTPAYGYSWSNGAVGATQSALCAATYTVTLTDANSCTATRTVVVGTSQVLIAAVTQTDLLCNALCTGTANITMSGGTSPFTFTWSNGAAVSSASSLCANTYTVSINDALGCNVTQTIALTEPAAITTSQIIVTATCGLCNGQISVTPAGGTGAFSYTWGTGANTPTISGLCAGVYILDIGDANGCSQSFNIPLNNTNGPTASTIVKTDATCFGVNDGTATVTPNGGTPAYTFSWLTTGQTIGSVTSLPGGVNLVQIIDANGCIRTDTVNIGSPSQINTNQVVTNATCGLNDGQISVSPTGGIGPYTYTWSGGATTATITGLAAATYNLTITDATSCTQTASIPVSNNNAPAITVTVQDLGCKGVCTGSASISVSGGIPPYAVSWSTTATGNTVSNLCAATYTVSVTDASNCTTISTVVISEPTVLSLTAPATSQVTCSAACNGTAAALPTGGTLPYTFSWSNGSTATTVNSLCSGTYTISVMDANGCSATQSITIVPSPTPFSVSPNVTNATCGLCDGQASVTVIGGTSPYNFLWSNGATGSTVSSLCAAVYSIDIKDASGCTASFFLPVSNVGGPTSSGATITNILCNGQCSGGASVAPVGGTAPYTYLWLPLGMTTQSISNVCAGTAFIEITDAKGCILTDTIDITEPTPFAANESITQPSGCGVSDGAVTLNPSGGTAPFGYTWSNGSTSATLTNILAGIYTVTITDAVGCAQSKIIAINNSNALSLSSIVTNVSCFSKCDGKAIITATSGVQPYTYLWNTNPASTIDTAKALCAGTYFVQVSDAAGCITVSSVTISEPIPLILNSPLKKDASCAAVCNGSATVLPAGGALPYVYSWSTAATAASISNLCSGNYSITVTDLVGCSALQSMTISDNPTPIVITSTITNATCNVCNGVAMVTVTGGTTPFTYLWSNGSTTSSSNSLCAGVQAINITDGVGCKSIFNLPISNTGGPTSSAKVVTNATCFGLCNGTASLTPTGGTPPYTYNWLPPAGVTAATVSGLCGGLGFVQIADSSGCILTDSILVGSPAQINIAAVTIQPSTCNAADGSITLNVSGGAGTYTYLWSNAGTGATQANAVAGAYGVTITDASGCTQTTVITLNDKSGPTISLVGTDVTCFGNCNGKAVVTANGGTPGYTYSWNTIPSVTIDTAKTLCSGTYFVQVTDNIGCKISSSVTITQPTLLTMNSPITTNASCAAICNGTATVLPIGGTLPYSYKWNTLATTPGIGNLCSGNYSVTVTDAIGCSAVQALSISTSPTPIVITSAVTKSTCGVCNGQATVTVVSGNSPFTYLWTNSSTINTATGLCAGVHSVDITDNVGCTSNFSLPISSVGGPTSSGKTISNATCFGLCNGSASVSPIGGTLPYTYNWLPSGQTGATVSGLCGGLGFVQIADSSGCILTDSILVGSPTQINIAASTIPPSTCNVADGSILLSVLGGSGTYSYAWSIAGTGATQTNIVAGAYGVTVTDASGCTQTTVVALNDRFAPTLSRTVTDISCFGRCDGKAIIKANGGTLPYTYSWSNIPSSSIDTAKALCAGTYFVQVTDNIGCKISSSVAITEPAALNLGISSTTSEKCFGSCDGSITAVPSGGTSPYTYSWSSFTGTTAIASPLCIGRYVITITDVKGCTVQRSDSVRSPAPMVVVKSPVNAKCNNTKDGAINISVSGGGGTYTYTWKGPGTFASNSQNLTGLYEGSYPLTITDVNGCLKLDTVIVSAITTVIAKAGNDTSFCEGSSLVLNGANSIPLLGSSYTWLQSPANTIVGSTALVTLTPPAGVTSYLLIATNGVCSDTDAVVVSANPAPIVDAGPDQSIFTLQTTLIGGTPTTGSAGATFIWTPGKELSDSTSANPDATPLGTTLYKVVVKDINGCTASDTVRLTVLPEIRFNNGITPNGDGKNDTWIIDNIQKFQQSLVEVYNRWGDLLFSSVGYGTPWDGKYKGAELPVGTYYYVIKLNDPLFPNAFTGPITLMR